MSQHLLFVMISLFFISCTNKKLKKESFKKNEKDEVSTFSDSLKFREVINDEDISLKSKVFVNKELVLGKFSYRKDTTFVKVQPNYSSKEIYLNKEVYEAFKRMHKDALQEDVKLIIVSGTRSFYQQTAIWERKWGVNKNLEPIDRSLKILEYSSMPGTSRHHWGTDIDINNLNNSYFDSGRGKKEYEWLTANAHNYGFCQVYTSKEQGRKGYNEEKWHWSYLPLATEYLRFYNKNINYNDIVGFKGDSLSSKINVIEEYVNGIDLKCKQ